MKTAVRISARTAALSALVLWSLLGAQGAQAATTWSWSYTEPVINVATESDLYLTVTNSADSDANIAVANLSLFDFGDFGLLYEPGGHGVIIPTISGSDLVLSPGQSGQFLAITFTLQPTDLPTPGVSYTINPPLYVEVGAGCDRFGGTGCQTASEAALAPLEIIYAPVPEPSTALECLVGLMFLGGAAAWVRRKPPLARQA